MQGKRHIKIELCVKSSLLRLFHVNHVVQNRQSALSPACHKCGFHVKAKNERFTAASFRCRQKLKVKTSRCRLADYVKTSHQKACRTCSTIIFLHSTNQIIDLWRCRWRCRRQILNSLLWGLRIYDGCCNYRYYFKIEINVRLSVSQLFHVGGVVQNKQSMARMVFM